MASRSNGENDVSEDFKDLNLKDTLSKLGYFDSIENVRKRDEILKEMNSHVKEWLLEESSSYSKSSLHSVEKFVYPFGSYALGFIEEDSNMDLICMAPENIPITTFFSSFSLKLQQLRDVTSMRKIPKTLIPVLLLTYKGVKLNLVYANVNIRDLSRAESLQSSDIYYKLDEPSMLNVHSYQVANDIYASIARKEEFGIALRAIKLWAKGKKIYYAKYGFLGGVSWTILLVYINQLYPSSDASTLVAKFFETFHNWPWPKPVTIKASIPVPRRFLTYNWSTVNRIARSQIMPILTPTSPRRNCAYNVSKSSLKIIMSELRNGNLITKRILKGQDDWLSLVKADPFFTAFKYFLLLRATAAKSVEQDFAGLISGSIHFFLKYLSELTHVDKIRVLPDSFNSELGNNEMIWIIGIESSDEYQTKRLGFSSAICKFKDQIVERAEESNIPKSKIMFDIEGVEYDNLKSTLPKDIYHKILS
ncbi:unnamed protein product [Dimorphilus gyrociliatus]|uniref:polynucleotide adenylyltransferase n=1 Tax=Dimorphilus gyrociliatus TaxID=2664684 RepID=A0A7I8V5I9_9ANNE|nr:unnamed protein product [Dimorphilus gyrociliatus]